MHLDHDAIAAMERFRRAALINSITGFKPANLVGTVSDNGQSNLAIMSSLVHIGSNPPLLALVFRPDTAERHTLDNIRSTGIYTINHVHRDIVDAAHQTAARYARDSSEFAATGLEEAWRNGWEAPFVKAAEVCIAMQLREEQKLEINGCHLVIGEIQSIELPEHALIDTGALDPAAAGSVALSGLDAYYLAQPLCRMAYAKPELPPRRLPLGIDSPKKSPSGNA
ncbi:MAG: flavin reductase family protein [Congregibacter sp.]